MQKIRKLAGFLVQKNICILYIVQYFASTNAVGTVVPGAVNTLKRGTMLRFTDPSVGK